MLSGFSSGYSMVTLVRPNSMFLKCLNAMARPATIAGRYNRSRQFNLGRGTVTAMDPQRCCTGLNRFKDQQWLLGSLLHPNFGAHGVYCPPRNAIILRGSDCAT